MDRLRKYLRILLPALFIAYLGCIIAFTHVHIVNGVTIVHSHPYHKTDDGRPDHEHGYAEFQLLHQLSVLQITGAAFVAILLAAFYSFIHNGLVRESVQGLSFLVTNEFTFIYSVLYCVSSQLHAQEHTYKQYICY